jgi:hypothetical protein
MQKQVNIIKNTLNISALLSNRNWNFFSNGKIRFTGMKRKGRANCAEKSFNLQWQFWLLVFSNLDVNEVKKCVSISVIYYNLIFSMQVSDIEEQTGADRARGESKREEDSGRSLERIHLSLTDQQTCLHRANIMASKKVISIVGIGFELEKILLGHYFF